MSHQYPRACPPSEPHTMLGEPATVSHPHLTLMLPRPSHNYNLSLGKDWTNSRRQQSFGCSRGPQVVWEPTCIGFRLHKIRFSISLSQITQDVPMWLPPHPRPVLPLNQRYKYNIVSLNRCITIKLETIQLSNRSYLWGGGISPGSEQDVCPMWLQLFPGDSDRNRRVCIESAMCAILRSDRKAFLWFFFIFRNRKLSLHTVQTGTRKKVCHVIGFIQFNRSSSHKFGAVEL